MKNLKKISKYLQIMVLLAFFLPFFPAGCEPKKAETTPVTDSTLIAMDSTQTNTKLTASTDSITQSNDSTKQGITEKLSKKSKLLKLILRPDDNFSGVGYLLGVSEILILECGAAIAFILWIIGLVVKLKDYNTIFHLINFLALMFFYFTSPGGLLNIFGGIKLWGYWICLGFGVIIVLFDAFIFIKQRKSQNQNPDFSI